MSTEIRKHRLNAAQLKYLEQYKDRFPVGKKMTDEQEQIVKDICALGAPRTLLQIRRAVKYMYPNVYSDYGFYNSQEETEAIERDRENLKKWLAEPSAHPRHKRF